MIFAEFNLLTFLPYSELLISTTCNIERQYYISNTFHYKLHFLIIKFHVWNISMIFINRLSLINHILLGVHNTGCTFDFRGRFEVENCHEWGSGK